MSDYLLYSKGSINVNITVYYYYFIISEVPGLFSVSSLWAIQDIGSWDCLGGKFIRLPLSGTKYPFMG